MTSRYPYKFLFQDPIFAILLVVILLANHGIVYNDGSGSSVVAFSTHPSIGSSSKNPVEHVPTPSYAFQYTHLEVNGMLWSIPEADISLVIDPIASELNFGIPWGYRANKRFLDEQSTLDTIVRAQPTHCLLSQGLDDHTHLPTLKKLIRLLPDLQFVVAPSAYEKINSILTGETNARSVTVVAPGESVPLQNKKVILRATSGALVGPPWQARENGWHLRVIGGKLSIYTEPHADVTMDALRQVGQADIIISPVREQSLPAQVPKPGQFTLVYGGQRTLEIAQTLQASVVIPLGNGELITTGPLAKLVTASGSVEDFERLVTEANKKQTGNHVRVERSTPGVPLVVQIK